VNGYELSGWSVSRFVETLAAAYAETGDFAAAVKFQERALSMIPLAIRDLPIIGARDRLVLYREQKPYRE